MNKYIALADNNNIISSEIEIAGKLNACFNNIVKELNIKVKICYVISQILTTHFNDPVQRVIQKHKNYPSIQIIKETFDNNKTFSFDLVSSENIFIENRISRY